MQSEDQPIRVRVTIPEPIGIDPAEQGRRMAVALDALAAMGSVNIPDPLAWQREQRADRELPCRT